MPNISNDELKKILIPEEALKYLEEHPSFYNRAAKIHAKEMVICQKKATKYGLDKTMEKIKNLSDLVNKNPELFPD